MIAVGRFRQGSCSGGEVAGDGHGAEGGDAGGDEAGDAETVDEGAGDLVEEGGPVGAEALGHDAGGGHGVLGGFPCLGGEHLEDRAAVQRAEGDSLTGEEAERLGLMSICTPDDEVLPRALAIAERIATNAQYAVRWTKHALNAWVRQQAPLFELSTALQLLTLHGADMRSAMSDLASGKPPRFPSVDSGDVAGDDDMQG